MEIILSGRCSDESDGVADGARSLLLTEAVERRGDSVDGNSGESGLHVFQYI